MGAPAGARVRLVDEVADRLAAAGVASPRWDARMLVEHAGREALGGSPLGGCQLAVLEGLVARRAGREPLQLVLGRTWFRELELSCAPGVFIPRPETEVLAGEAVAAAGSAGPAPVVVEPCTGTGAVGLSVAVEVPGAQVVATDRSAAAVTLARRNLDAVAAGRAGPRPADGAQVTILEGDLLEPLAPSLRGRVDVLVANPPYLPADDAGSWPPEVVRHDPRDALVGGTDGHEVVRRLLDAAAAWLRPGGLVALEIDARRADEATVDALAAGLAAPGLVRDLTGARRILVARRPADARTDR